MESMGLPTHFLPAVKISTRPKKNRKRKDKMLSSNSDGDGSGCEKESHDDINEPTNAAEDTNGCLIEHDDPPTEVDSYGAFDTIWSVYGQYVLERDWLKVSIF
jgi:hypothetical protein